MAFNFMFTTNFSNLLQPEIDSANTVITTMFAGISDLWSNDNNGDSKRLLLTNFLMAWYLSDLNPSRVLNVVADGGKPLDSKDIGGTKIAFKEIATQMGLEQLTTNTFGIKALLMFYGAPERYQLYGRSCFGLGSFGIGMNGNI